MEAPLKLKNINFAAPLLLPSLSLWEKGRKEAEVLLLIKING